MARKTQLGQLLNMLRAEARLSTNPAHNSQVRDSHVALLQRVQEQIWGDFDWPHLRVERQYPAQAGQRYYDWGDDFDIDRIQKVEVKSDGVWVSLIEGISAEHYADVDSDLGSRSWPPNRWRISEDEQIEIWPISDLDGTAETREAYFKVTGIRRLNPLVDERDRADLDDQMLVLFAAAELLGPKDGQAKLSLANSRYAKLRGALMPRRRFRMFGVGQRASVRRHVIPHYRPTGS